MVYLSSGIRSNSVMDCTLYIQMEENRFYLHRIILRVGFLPGDPES
jgi:hypothetical protein